MGDKPKTNTGPTLVDASFLAARWGVSARMIRDYVEKYGMPVAVKGRKGPGGSPKYNLAQAEAWHGTFVPDPSGGRKTRHAGDAPDRDRIAENEAKSQWPEKEHEGDTPREQASKYKLIQEREKARKLQIENDKRAGKLVEHAVVIEATSRLLGEVRVQLESIPHRLAPDLAASALVDQQAVDAIRKELAARGTDDERVESLCAPLTRVGLESEIRRVLESSVRQTLRELSEPQTP